MKASTSTGSNSDKLESVTLIPEEIHDNDGLGNNKITIRIKIMLILTLTCVVSRTREATYRLKRFDT